MNNKQRLICFDLLKFFAIYLVIWGHCIQYLVDSEAFDNPVFINIYSFHMPLFMMISGFFARKSLENKRPSDILRNKFVELIVPCASIGGVLLLIHSVKILFVDAVETTSFSTIFDTVIVKDLWFLKSLFCCFLLATLAFSNKKHLALKVCFTILISFFLNFYMIKRMYLFFILGIVMSYNFEVIKRYAKLICTLSFVIFTLLLSGYDKVIYLTQIGDVKDALMSTNVSIITQAIGAYFYNIITGLTGCTTFITLFFLLDNKFSYKNKIVTSTAKIGQFTLGIYIMQYIILERNLPRFIQPDDSTFLSLNFIFIPFLAAIILTACYWITRLITRNRIMTFLLLGKR